MQVSIRNNWISCKGSSKVKDMNEVDVLEVEGKFFTFTQKKFVKSLDGNLLYMVRNKFWSFFVKKAFVFDKDEKQVALVKRKFFSLRDRYFIESSLGALEITGNILGFDYHILLNGEEVGHISRKISLRDSFVLDLKDGLDLPFFVALVIAIDNITDRRRDESSVSFSSSSSNY